MLSHQGVFQNLSFFFFNLFPGQSDSMRIFVVRKKTKNKQQQQNKPEEVVIGVLRIKTVLCFDHHRSPTVHVLKVLSSDGGAGSEDNGTFERPGYQKQVTLKFLLRSVSPSATLSTASSSHSCCGWGHSAMPSVLQWTDVQ